MRVQICSEKRTNLYTITCCVALTMLKICRDAGLPGLELKTGLEKLIGLLGLIQKDNGENSGEANFDFTRAL